MLAACLSGARGRAMRPAWESWRELVEREREEEDAFAGREEGLLAFASVVTRVARRRDRDRRLRAFGVWRLGAARSAVTAARHQLARGSEAVRAVEVENVSLFVTEMRRHYDTSSDFLFGGVGNARKVFVVVVFSLGSAARKIFVLARVERCGSGP